MMFSCHNHKFQPEGFDEGPGIGIISNGNHCICGAGNWRTIADEE